MSDMSMLHRSLGQMPQMPALPPVVTPPPTAVPGTRELPLDELEIRHLRSADEIGRVIHLRSEINLPAAALADPAFAPREKKETSTVLWPVSSGAAPTLELSASSRWASDWRLARVFC